MAFTHVSYANMPFWGCLPMGMSNYGGDVQVFNMPEYSYRPVSLMFNAPATAQLNGAGYSNYTIPTATVDQTTVDNLADQMYKSGMTPVVNNEISSIKNTISSTKAKLNSKLATEGISDENRAKVEELLRKLDEQEKKLNQVLKNESLELGERYKQLKEIEVALRTIAADTAQLDVTPHTEEPEGASESTEETTSTTETASAEETEETDETTEAEETEETEETNMNQDMETYQVAQMFREACDGCGTDDKKFEAICSAINKDNVMELMLAYNETESSINGESFMETFMWDADHSQKAKYGKQIADALKAKALELGVFEECREDFDEIYSELDDLTINNGIYKNYDNIVKIIAEKMDKPYSEPKKSFWQKAYSGACDFLDTAWEHVTDPIGSLGKDLKKGWNALCSLFS